jgi:hypothetical protein
MKYCKLRIAGTLVGAMAWLLLVGFCVHSVHRQDNFDLHLSQTKSFGITSWRGWISFQYMWASKGTLTPYRGPGGLSSHRITKEMAAQRQYAPAAAWGYKLAGLGTYNALQVTVPFWFPIVLSSLVTVAPWLQRRFSMRTLLLAISAVAIQIGLLSALARCSE